MTVSETEAQAVAESEPEAQAVPESKTKVTKKAAAKKVTA